MQCYDPERCICDCIRARGKIDKITYVRAMKRYFGALKDPSRILHYAQRLKVKREAEMYAEVLMPEENIV